MNQKTKQLKLYKYLGQQLGIKSVYFLKHAFDVKTTDFTRDELKRIVKEKTNIDVYSADRTHYFTDWGTWRQLILYDWTDKKKYLKDQYDCDNYASSFCARMSEIYGLNTAGRLFCDVYNANNGEKIAAHVAVLIVDKDKRVFLMESQTDKVLEITSSDQELIIGSWRYELRYVRFN